MAQFITHIQPTLVEASHHHVPHPHPHHHKEHHEKHEKHEKPHEKHHKESDIPHNKDIHGWIHLPKIGKCWEHPDGGGSSTKLFQDIRLSIIRWYRLHPVSYIPTMIPGNI